MFMFQPAKVTESIQHSRRTVLKGVALSAAAVAGATAFRGFDAAAAAAPAHDGIFGYGVASGDPTADAVVIWTRATPPPRRVGDPVATPGSGLGVPLLVAWEVAYDQEFRHIVRAGVVRTSPRVGPHREGRRATACRRTPGTTTDSWRRARSARSAAPRRRRTTRTGCTRCGSALVSCSNYTGGYFGAYRALGQRDDLDFVLHVGDYIYEYGNGADRYGPAALVGKRDGVPATETIDLRGLPAAARAAQGRPGSAGGAPAAPVDHDLRRPRGRQQHLGNRRREPHARRRGRLLRRRRREAYEAYLEWMPFRLPEQRHVPHQGTRFFKRFTFGPLGDLSVLETRQNRSEQIDVAPFTKTGGGFIPIGIPPVDAALADPTRHLPEPEQLDWLKDSVGRYRTALAPDRQPGRDDAGPLSRAPRSACPRT